MIKFIALVMLAWGLYAGFSDDIEHQKNFETMVTIMLVLILTMVERLYSTIEKTFVSFKQLLEGKITPEK